jgi:hypothetical protein
VICDLGLIHRRHRLIGSLGHFRFSRCDLRFSDAALPVSPPWGFACFRHSSLLLKCLTAKASLFGQLSRHSRRIGAQGDGRFASAHNSCDFINIFASVGIAVCKLFVFWNLLAQRGSEAFFRNFAGLTSCYLLHFQQLLGIY